MVQTLNLCDNTNITELLVSVPPTELAILIASEVFNGTEAKDLPVDQIALLINRFLLRDRKHAEILATELIRLCRKEKDASSEFRETFWQAVSLKINRYAMESLLHAFLTSEGYKPEDIKRLFHQKLCPADKSLFKASEIFKSSFKCVNLPSKALESIVKAAELCDCLKDFFGDILQIWSLPMRILHNNDMEYQLMLCKALILCYKNFDRESKLENQKARSYLSEGIMHYLSCPNERIRYSGLFTAEILSPLVYGNDSRYQKLDFGFYSSQSENDMDFIETKNIIFEFMTNDIKESLENLTLDNAVEKEEPQCSNDQADSDDESDVSSLAAFQETLKEEKPREVPNFIWDFVSLLKSSDEPWKQELALKHLPDFIQEAYCSIDSLMNKRDLHIANLFEIILNLHVNSNNDSWMQNRFLCLKAVVKAYPEVIGLDAINMFTSTISRTLGIIQRKVILSVLTCAAVELMSNGGTSAPSYQFKDMSIAVTHRLIAGESSVVGAGKTRILHPRSRELRMASESGTVTSRSAYDYMFLNSWFSALCTFEWIKLYLNDDDEMQKGLINKLKHMDNITLSLLTSYIKTLATFVQLCGPFNLNALDMLYALNNCLAVMWNIFKNSTLSSNSSFVSAQDVNSATELDQQKVSALYSSDFRSAFLQSVAMQLAFIEENPALEKGRNIALSSVFPFELASMFLRHGGSGTVDSVEEMLMEWMMVDVAKWDATPLNRQLASFILSKLQQRCKSFLPNS